MFIRGSQVNIPDISELKSGVGNKEKTDIITVESRRVSRPEKSAGILSEYLSNRRYYILALSVIYLLGAAVGAMLVRNLELSEIIDLCPKPILSRCDTHKYW